MDIQKMCPHCMHQTESYSRCTNCGKDPKNTRPLTYQLKVHSVLQDKYLVGEVLREDEFVITYMGLNINSQVPVTIKEFYSKESVSRESVVNNTIYYNDDADKEMLDKMKEKLLKEAKGRSGCAHLPSVISLKDYFEENNTVYIVEECVDGQTLQQYVDSRGGKIPVNEVIPMFQALMSDLNEVHMQGVIHRNINPNSILFLKNGTIKLVDFGWARNVCVESDKRKLYLLKSEYAAEEQQRYRGEIGNWTDIYSLCATIYRCITGVTPVNASERFGSDSMKWPKDLGVTIGLGQEEALKKGMSFLSGSRFQSMQELSDALCKADDSKKTGNSSNVISEITSNLKSMVDDIGSGVGSIFNKTKGMVPKKESKAAPGNDEPEENDTPKTEEKKKVSKKAPKENPLKNIKVNKTVVLAVVAGIICICVLGGVIGFLVKNKGNKKEDKDFNSQVAEEQIPTEEQDSKSEETAVPEANLKKLEELKTTAQSLEGVDGWDMVLGTVEGILISNEGSKEVQDFSMEIYNEFYENSLEYIAMIEGIGSFSADTYKECIIRYEELEKWNETLKCGYEEDLERNIEVCKQKFKERFVERFDTKCVETLNQNGVVSRTVAWDTIQGVENTDLYNSSGDRYDALRLRYIAAKVLKIHKDIDGMYLDDAINMIRNAMVECDYDPMLVYLLYINEYEPAQTWIMEVEALVERYAGEPYYSLMADNDRINFVYLYNAFPDKFKECREAVIEYMQKNYK